VSADLTKLGSVAASAVSMCWLPTPKIEVRGEYSPEPGHREALLASRADTTIWHPRLQVRLPDDAGIPLPPPREALPWSCEPGTAYLGPAEVYPPEIGDGSALTKVTGFIPNGWDGHGSRVGDPADRRRTWFGRATARGVGWVLDMDALDPGGQVRGKLRREGGYGITHAVSLSRPDASPFTADDATQALHAVRSALSLILGRRTDVVLPVGWNHDQPAWARWTAGQVDTFREPGTWLDASIAADQAGEVIGRFLDCWPTTAGKPAGQPPTPRFGTLQARNGLIQRVPGRNRYTLTRDGLLFACFCTKVYDHVPRPLMAPDRPNAPPELRAALDTLDQLVADHTTRARVPVAA
jgi:hypothetical protein